MLENKKWYWSSKMDDVGSCVSAISDALYTVQRFERAMDIQMLWFLCSCI
jgi:hypothetical protein